MEDWRFPYLSLIDTMVNGLEKTEPRAQRMENGVRRIVVIDWTYADATLIVWSILSNKAAPIMSGSPGTTTSIYYNHRVARIRTRIGRHLCDRMLAKTIFSS